MEKNILNILGAAEREHLDVAPPIQREIAHQWNNLLRQGLDDKDRQSLMSKYKIPENCQSAAPPKLNPEIKAAVNETAIKETKDWRRCNLRWGQA